MLDNSYFENMNSDIIKIVHKNGTKFTYKSHETLLKPRDIINEIFYIDEGSVRYLITSYNGVERVLTSLNKGEFFGIGPINLDNSISDISVITETPTVIYKITKSKYLHLIKTSDIFRNEIIKSLSLRATTLISKIINLSFTSGKERLYEFLLHSVDIDSSSDGIWYGLNDQFTQDELARIIGVSRMSIYKIIKELTEEDLIRIINRRLEMKMV